MVLYFAYGGNLHPLRLAAIAPSSGLVAAAVLDGHELRFHKRSLDGSAKCDAFPHLGAAVHGVVYRLNPVEQSALDRAERGYDRVAVTVGLVAPARPGSSSRAARPSPPASRVRRNAWRARNPPSPAR